MRFWEGQLECDCLLEKHFLSLKLCPDLRDKFFDWNQFLGKIIRILLIVFHCLKNLAKVHLKRQIKSNFYDLIFSAIYRQTFQVFSFCLLSVLSQCPSILAYVLLILPLCHHHGRSIRKFLWSHFFSWIDTDWSQPIGHLGLLLERRLLALLPVASYAYRLSGRWLCRFVCAFPLAFGWTAPNDSARVGKNWDWPREQQTLTHSCSQRKRKREKPSARFGVLIICPQPAWSCLFAQYSIKNRKRQLQEIDD